MLLAHFQEGPSHDFFHSYQIGTPQTRPPMLDFLSMGNDSHCLAAAPDSQAAGAVAGSGSGSQAGGLDSGSEQVAQALEIARESPEGAKDSTVRGILESALAQIWSRVRAAPDSYVMSREEFAVFNFFQDRFQGNELAAAARARFWDNLSANS
ncbi:hypothetical protein GGR56DRAFT_590373 [Xylariaceae sp. FL0804]|nr:hypothetical protein GGR56DRAFT_590373 [Xylariaceae sp. FL0804]